MTVRPCTIARHSAGPHPPDSSARAGSAGAQGTRADYERALKLGETTEDGRITLVREEECLAGCCGAPMAVVDGHYKENLDIDALDALLDGLE